MKLTKKQAFWQSHIKAQLKSGKSRSEYCGEQGIDSRHFGFYVTYLRKKKKNESKDLGFVCLDNPGEETVRIFLTNGIKLECTPSSVLINRIIGGSIAGTK